MALAKAVKGARHSGQRITWLRDDNTPVDLTGATLAGRIKPKPTGSARNVDGTLSVVDPTTGIFQWAYGALDVGTAGTFEVQFSATFADTFKDISYSGQFIVKDAI